MTENQALDGLPDNTLATASAAAAEQGLSGWLLKLDFPVYYAVQRSATDRNLRELFYRAWSTRASDQFQPSPSSPPGAVDTKSLLKFDNSDIMLKILEYRHQLALALGFHSYADLSLARKMAHSPGDVLKFLEELTDRALPVARQDVQAVRDFARKNGLTESLAPWDLTFYAERMREQTLDLDQETLRPYFPLQHVLAGMFGVLKKLFGVEVALVSNVTTWHPDAKLYAIHDLDKTIRGYFFLDPFSREGKRGGAWMDECRSRHRFGGELQVPVAYLTCNFAAPAAGQDALLTHDEMQTLFHETGHGIHHMLTDVEIPSVGGINGVAWDAVELPSQLLENWCWESESLRELSKHVETGEPLDDATIERLRAARTFMAGQGFVRQLEFALFDMRTHCLFEPGKDNLIMQVLDQVRAELSVLEVPAYNRFPNAFTHVFGGGYAAGYYSYKWAELLSSDAFSRFEEDGLFDATAGLAFRQHVLANGGTEPADTLYQRFRGRQPDSEALLRHNGL